MITILIITFFYLVVGYPAMIFAHRKAAEFKQLSVLCVLWIAWPLTLMIAILAQEECCGKKIIEKILGKGKKI